MWIFYEAANGRVVPVALAGRREGETTDQWVQRVAARAVPAGRRWFAISDPSAIPEPGPDQVLVADWTNKTLSVGPRAAAEIDEEKEEKTSRLFDGPLLAIAKWAFDAENRVRKLEGRPALTALQFRALLKSLL